MLTKLSKKIVIFSLLFIFGYQTTKAQDFLLSQFYANPLYLNPALAGSVVCPRVSLGYRNQWPSVPGAFVTFTGSYDQYFDAISGGIGVFLSTDEHGAFRSSTGSLMYAYRLQVSKSFFISAALKASFVNEYLDWNSLTFPDQIDPTYGFISGISSAQMPDNTNIFYADFGGGIVGYTDYFYAGAAFDHITSPSQGFYGVAKLPMKITAHAGGLINVAPEKRRTSTLGLKSPVISPNVIYQHMLNFNYLNYGLYLDWMPIIIGVWFRQGFENPDAFTFLIGVQQPSFKIGYSYDLTISGLSNQTGGSHEVTLGFQFPCPAKKKKVKTIRCPSF